MFKESVAIEMLRDELRALRADVARERERNAQLVETLVAMRREGFAPPPVEPTVARPEDLPPGIQAAIAERGRTTGMQQDLLAFARAELARGIDPQAIEDAIWSGGVEDGE
jgi:hypothetical protein